MTIASTLLNLPEDSSTEEILCNFFCFEDFFKNICLALVVGIINALVTVECYMSSHH